MNALYVKRKNTKGVSPCELVVAWRRLLASGRWWRHDLIPSVGRDIQHRAERDKIISLKEIAAVNALSAKTKTKKRVSPCKLVVAREDVVG